MRVYLRNKGTGEIREVEADSGEFRELQQQVTVGGLSMWEQTHFPHADALQHRAETDQLREEDLGWDQQDKLRYEALRLDSEGVAPESNPHLALTPGEIEMGLTPEQKLSDLKAMFADRTGRKAVFHEAVQNITGSEPEQTEAQKQASKGKGASARAGGTDKREEAPQAATAGGE